MLETFIFSMLFNIVMFLIAYAKRTDKLTDISYSLTFTAIAIYGAVRHSFGPIQWLVLALVLLWAFRLGSYLLIRIHTIGRDKRFDGMRENFWRFGKFWLLQGLTVWVVMLPVNLLYETGTDNRLVGLTIFGALISLIGIVIESVADWQKFNFIQDKKNKDKWISSGLWKYSRHPNYFGEMLMWYGIYAVVFPWLGDSQRLIGLAGPLFITVLLVGVSGIPLLEKSADKKWGRDKQYQRYKRSTSVLIPLPHR